MTAFRSFVFAAAFAGAATAAQAATFGFTNITNNNAGDAAIGEAQFSLDVTDAGGGLVDFTFVNAGPAQSTMATLYFDDAAGLIDSIALNNVGGPVFSLGATPPVLPGGNGGPVFFTTDFGATASPPPPSNGVTAGESYTITATLLAGFDFDDVIAALSVADISEALRVGVHAIAFASGGSESFITGDSAVIPLPAAGWLLLTGLAGLGFAAKRRKAA